MAKKLRQIIESDTFKHNNETYKVRSFNGTTQKHEGRVLKQGHYYTTDARELGWNGPHESREKAIQHAKDNSVPD